MSPAGQAELFTVPVAGAGQVVVSGVSDTPGGVAQERAMLRRKLPPPKIATATFPAEQYDHWYAVPPNQVNVDVSAVLSVPSEFSFVHRA
jgi:hypothetical protein